MADQQSERNEKGHFVKGHTPLKRKGTQHKSTRDLKARAEKVARKLGGRAGIAGYLEAHPKLLNDILIAAARERAVAVDEDGNAVDRGPVVDMISIVGIPQGGQYDALTGEVYYRDSAPVEPVAFAGFVASPEIPERAPHARIKQLEERVELLEARNAYLECLLDPRRARSAFPAVKPQLVINNRGADATPIDDDPPPGAA